MLGKICSTKDILCASAFNEMIVAFNCAISGPKDRLWETQNNTTWKFHKESQNTLIYFIVLFQGRTITWQFVCFYI